MKFAVNLNFKGSALLEINAANAEEARKAAEALTMADLARAGFADIIHLDLAVREVKPMTDQSDADDSSGPSKPRPSGWYRPA